MKKLFVLCSSLLMLSVSQAQSSKVLYFDQGGTLSQSLSASEKQIVTDLTISGHIDARDFKTMRDSMPLLQNVDLSEAIIDSCDVPNGTDYINHLYEANVFPDAAFYDTSKNGRLQIASVKLPLTCTRVGECAFNNCRHLSVIAFPPSITAIDGYAFSGCSGLTSVFIPSQITSIEGGAFYGCINLIFLTVSNANKFYSSDGYNLYNKDKTYLFYHCNTTDTKFIIPATLVNFENGAFDDSKNLTNFDDYNNENPIFSTDDGVLYSEDKSTLVLCPLGREGEVSIPSTVKTIRQNAFSGCTKISSITIPNTVTEIESGAFVGCIGLRSISIPDSVKEIKEGLFNSCTQLQTVQLPNSLTAIHDAAFVYCTALQTISIPKGVTHLGNANFFSCSGLQSIQVLNPDPVDISNLYQIFEKVSRTIPLYVPQSSKAAYVAAAVWNEFSIVEMSKIVEEDTIVIDNEVSLQNSFNLLTNGTWSASTSQDWLRISNRSTSFDSASSSIVDDTSKTLYFVAKPNQENPVADRYGVITLNLVGQTKTVIIKQTKLYAVDYVSDIDLPEHPDSISSNDTAFCIAVQYSRDWLAYSSSDWLRFSFTKVDFASAKKTVTLETKKDTTVMLWFIVDRNLTSESRTALFSVAGMRGMSYVKNELYQAAAQVDKPKLELSNSVVELDSSQTKASIDVTANKDWTATSDADWLLLSLSDKIKSSPSKSVSFTATKDTTVRLWFFVDENISKQDRTGTITIAINGEEPKVIKVTLKSDKNTSQTEMLSKTVSLFPNPTTESFSFDIVDSAKVLVYDGTRLLFGQTIEANEKVSVKHLPEGEYIILLQTAGSWSTHKLIKQ